MFLSIDDGRSRIYSSGTSQAARRRCFLASMVDAPGSTALTPPRGAAFDIFSVDGDRSRIYSSSTSQGARRRRLLALIVAAPRYIASAPSRGPTVDVS
jgi:hypothetical protein